MQNKFHDMGEMCSMRGRDQNHIWKENPKTGNYVEHVGVDEGILLKWIVNE